MQRQKPLEGRAARHRMTIAVAGDIHAGAGLHHYCQRGDSDHRREHGFFHLTRGHGLSPLFRGGERAISIPLTGWLAKRFGEVKLFVMVDDAPLPAASRACGVSAT